MRALFSKHANPATIIAIVALVFAMSGGAYALSGGGTGKAGTHAIAQVAKKKGKSKSKASSGKTGPRGPAGKQGPAGPAGPAGPTGPAGEKGAAGTNGTDGTNGANGTSVTSVAVPTTSTVCEKHGGAEFTAAEGEKTTACNGQTGFTETLPSGKTLEGDWSLDENVTGADEFVATSVSFGIPLNAAPAVHYIRENGMEPVLNANNEEEQVVSADCKGTAAEPKADAGNLCVYASSEEGGISHTGPVLAPKICAFGSIGIDCIIQTSVPASADKSGFGLVAFSAAAGRVSATGTWAVTAE